MGDPETIGDVGKAEEGGPQQSEHLNIKVTDNSNEVFFKIKRTTQLKKLMDVFCERQGKSPQTVRFMFDGQRVNATDNPDTVHTSSLLLGFNVLGSPTKCEQLEMQDGDTVEVYSEQIGGS